VSFQPRRTWIRCARAQASMEHTHATGALAPSRRRTCRETHVHTHTQIAHEIADTSDGRVSFNDLASADGYYSMQVIDVATQKQGFHTTGVNAHFAQYMVTTGTLPEGTLGFICLNIQEEHFYCISRDLADHLVLRDGAAAQGETNITVKEAGRRMLKPNTTAFCVSLAPSTPAASTAASTARGPSASKGQAGALGMEPRAQSATAPPKPKPRLPKPTQPSANTGAYDCLLLQALPLL
jgi:hypothetical protein